MDLQNFDNAWQLQVGYFMRHRHLLFILAITAVLASCGGEEATKTAEKCVESDLISQCPVGTQARLEAAATSQCGGETSGSYTLVEQEGSVTGACSGTGSCQVLCEFSNPCTCGVATISREKVVCATCEGGCGDGTCDPGETPDNCAMDCGSTCTPGDEQCSGDQRMVCNTQGVFEAFDCPTGATCELDTNTSLAICTGCDPDLLLVWYLDSDNDGFGDPTAPTLQSCSPIQGYVTEDRDCNDSNPNINPSATDGEDGVCDAIDNNCQNGPDDGAPVWYQDSDDDGFGATSTVVQSCGAPASLANPVMQGGDCDENNAEINPGAVDACDSVDNDCDDAIDEPDESNDACQSATLGNQTSICPAFSENPNGTPGEDRCETACNDGFADCDGDPSNGCEGDLNSTDHCGFCGHVCTGGTACLPEGCDSDVIDVTTGLTHSCAMRRNGEVVCWGEVPAGSRVITSPSTVTGISDAVELAAGTAHTCALLSSGQIQCWGSNAQGQLGTTTNPPDALTPVMVDNITNATAIIARNGTTCALLATGNVNCWGNSPNDELGSNGGSSSNQPVEIVEASGSALANVTAISMGDRTICALLNTSEVKCWGDNSEQQFGLGSPSFSTTPVLVPSIDSAIAVAVGWNHTCVSESDGGVRCWGSNLNREFGDNTMISSATPKQTVTLEGGVLANLGTGTSEIPIASVEAGEAFTCALRDNGDVACWGEGAANILTPDEQPFATSMPRLENIVSLSITRGHACAANTKGQVTCWGSPLYNRRGLDSRFPSQLLAPEDFIEVASGGTHTCGLRSDGEVLCWGGNNRAQAGQQTGTQIQFPLPVSTLSDATAIFAGGEFSCAIRANDPPVCWGYDGNGELGSNVTSTQSAAPVRIGSTSTGLENVVTLSTGATHACALISDGSVTCWGTNNAGQVGNGASVHPQPLPTTNAYFFTDDTVSHQASAIATTSTGSCAVEASTSEVLCWGGNAFGEIGNGTFDTPAGGYPTPSRVVSTAGNLSRTFLNNVVAIDGGSAHYCALLIDGRVACWGYNGFGELGNNTQDNSNIPVEVIGINNAVAVAAGQNVSCALLDTAEVKCWGHGPYTGTPNNSVLIPGDPVRGLTDAVGISARSQHICAVREGGQITCWGSDGGSRMGMFRLVTDLP